MEDTSISLLSPSLARPLERNILPHLSASALGTLNCTCKYLRGWLNTVAPSIWWHAAVGSLPARNPVPEHASVQTVQQMLQRYGASQRNIRRGQATAIRHYEVQAKDRHGVHDLVVSPTLQHFAINVYDRYGYTDILSHLCICEVDLGETIRLFDGMLIPSEATRDMAFSDDGQQLTVLHGNDYPYHPSQLHTINVTTGVVVTRALAHTIYMGTASLEQV